MPGKDKHGGGLEVKSAYKMKNSALYKSAKYGSPMQKNYESPLKKKPIKGEKGMSKKVEIIKNKKLVDTKYFIGETPTDSTTFNIDLKRRIKEGTQEKKG